MKTLNLSLVAILVLAATPTLAANVDVQLLNKGDKGAMVFQPDLVKIAVGDTVTYQSTDKGHNVDGAAGNIPAGATPFKGQMSQALTQTFTVPGVYVVKCDPHYGMGMVSVVEVGGDLSHIDPLKAVKNPKMAQTCLVANFAELK